MMELKSLFDLPESRKHTSQYQGNDVHLLDLDQYYTPDDVAVDCVKIIKGLGLPITEMFEASAGEGAFIRASKAVMPDIPIKAVDIEPKADGITQADFLKIYALYKQGRMFLGNPPFGSRLSLAVKFFKKCVLLGDYVAWILPISQLNKRSLYEFDLIHSQDIGEVVFSGQKPVRCCFNVYRRPTSGNLNRSPSSDCDSVKFMRSDNPNYPTFEYDFRICTWGGATGKILEADEADYASTYRVKVAPEYLERVKEILRNADWKKERPSVSCKKLNKATIVEVLKKNGIP